MHTLMRAGLVAGWLAASAGAQGHEARRDLAAAPGSGTGSGREADALRAPALKLFGRLQAPAIAPKDAAAVALGRALFWDTRISRDGKTACASCHQDWSADRRPHSIDARGKTTGRHSQPVFNAMQQPSLRWTGDRKNGADQARGSLTGSLGFDSRDAAVARLRELGYGEAFAAAFPGDPEPLSADNYGRALEAYQATLVTPAPFDEYLAGRDGALDAQQKRGLAAFVRSGCAGCHSGPLLGGTSLQRFGVVRDYWLETGSQKIDLGRAASTRKDEDRYVFRVPMLRNIARTAPYFHDGSVADLTSAVRVMASVQLGQKMDDATVADIVAFLGSLTGKVPDNYAPPGEHPALD